MVRLPREAIDQKTLKAFCTSPHLEFKKLPEHWLLTWSLGETEDYDRFGYVDEGPGLMTLLAPVREELLRGDLRSLYIGWLRAVTTEETDPDDLEPSALRGLNNLTATQQALAEFLEVDIDLLARVGSGSQTNRADAVDDTALDAWLAKLAADFPRAWKTAHGDANKGHAHAYDAACRQLVDLRDAYNQHATLAVFQKEFQKYMAEHSRRRALVQRLVKAGLWRDK